MSASSRVFRALHKTEDWLLTILALVLVAVASGQIVARVFGGAVPHADQVLKICVLWLAMLGAMAAARAGKHLGMDALLHVMPRWMSQISKAIGFLFAAWVCAKFCQYGYQFVQFERENPSGSPEDLIESWKVLWAFPIGFGGMALRFLWHAIQALVYLSAKPVLDPGEEGVT